MDYSKQYIESFEYYIEKAQRLIMEAPPGELDLKETAEEPKKIFYRLKVYNQTVEGAYELKTAPPIMKESLYKNQKIQANSVVEVTDEQGQKIFFHVGSMVVASLFEEILHTLQSKNLTFTNEKTGKAFSSKDVHELKVVNYAGKPIKIVDTIEFELVNDDAAKGTSQFVSLADGGYSLLLNYIVK